MLRESYAQLDGLRLDNGLYYASPDAHYSYVWVRDSVYIAMPFVNKTCGRYEETYHRLLDFFLEYEWKIDHHIEHRAYLPWQYLHAKLDSVTVKEIPDMEWGHAQHDMIGAFLFGVANGFKHGKYMFRDEDDRRITEKLVQYLNKCEYWHDHDNGMWEEWREVHMSSVGACVAGLEAIRRFVFVPQDMIDKGRAVIDGMFPVESVTRSVDLAQLSLIYPYNIFTDEQTRELIGRVESQLLRERGVIRYRGDSYYSVLEGEHGRDKGIDFYAGSEAEWCFGIPWLALCHLQLGNIDVAKYYVEKAEKIMVKPGVLPELYYSRTDKPNPNTPLGWSVAMYILAKEAIIHA